MKKILLILFIFLIYQTTASAEESVLIKAMGDELARSMEELKLEDKDGPYYLSYLVKDIYSLAINADSGRTVKGKAKQTAQAIRPAGRSSKTNLKKK